jgi:hypothetical protein
MIWRLHPTGVSSLDVPSVSPVRKAFMDCKVTIPEMTRCVCFGLPRMQIRAKEMA